jgi:hypothetical protein
MEMTKSQLKKSIFSSSLLLMLLMLRTMGKLGAQQKGGMPKRGQRKGRQGPRYGVSAQLCRIVTFLPASMFWDLKISGKI